MTGARAGPGHTRLAAAPSEGRAGGWGRTRLLLLVVGVLAIAGLAVILGSRPRAAPPGVASTIEPTGVAAAGGATPATAPTGGPASPSGARPAARPPLRLGPDETGRIRIPLTDARPLRLPMEGVPEGWSVKEFTGHAVVDLVRDDGQPALRLSSERASFALYRDVVVDLTATPWLTWSWKVTRLPHNGDVRSRATDDQAAQVYVIFPKWPAPLSHSDVLGYVWDSRAPVDTRVISPKANNVRVIVLQSGEGKGAWRRETRNVAADYAAVFGGTPPRVGKIALMIDSNDTRADAESLFGELVFSPRR